MKNRKLRTIIIAIILIIIIVAIIVAVKQIKKGKSEQDNNQQTADENGVYELPDTTYSDMNVNNIQMEYLNEKNETMVSMNIYNNTNKKCENERLIALLINNDGQIIRTNRNIYSIIKSK